MIRISYLPAVQGHDSGPKQILTFPNGFQSDGNYVNLRNDGDRGKSVNFRIHQRDLI
jgi:hypothetical protein